MAQFLKNVYLICIMLFISEDQSGQKNLDAFSAIRKVFKCVSRNACLYVHGGAS